MNLLALIPDKLRDRLIEYMTSGAYGQVTLHFVNGKIVKWDVRTIEKP